MALLDALAVRAQVPLWQMLGGEPFDVPLYAVGFTGSPEQAAVQAQTAIQEGFSAVKVRLGFGMDADLELLTAFRKTLGSTSTILADVNMGWSVEQALEMLPLLEDFDLGWLEEPVGRMDLAGLAAIGQRTKTPLAAGENCYSLEEASVLIKARAVNVFMPDIARLGGLLNSIVAVQRAQGAGLDYSPHHYASDIGFSAMLTLCAVMGPSQPILRDITPWALRHEVLLEPVALSDGTARVSNDPGIGPRPNMATIERYRVL
jgi:L-alanine-DL-glutamate epimerase-like enolase superfamily enzyme